LKSSLLIAGMMSPIDEEDAYFFKDNNAVTIIVRKQLNFAH
jgi:hypothetical protein